MKHIVDKNLISELFLKKKELLLLRVKMSSGQSISIKGYRDLKKSIAKIFTKLNKKI